MKILSATTAGVLLLLTTVTHAWESKVVSVLHHYYVVAVYLSPDPGPLGCQIGQPYLLIVDDTVASKQRFSMIMTALATGGTVSGYADGCSSAVWGVSRPVIERLQTGAP